MTGTAMEAAERLYDIAFMDGLAASSAALSRAYCCLLTTPDSQRQIRQRQAVEAAVLELSGQMDPVSADKFVRSCLGRSAQEARTRPGELS